MKILFLHIEILQICSPACTELEVIVMDWLGKLLDLPKSFLHSTDGNGGGIIQGSASESIFVAVLAAREQAVKRIQSERPELTESEIRGRLVAYSSDHSNSAIEKSGIMAAIKMRLLKSDENCCLRGEALQLAVEEDLKADRFPVVCIATLGTTGTCSYDNLEELGPICNQNKIWLHIDAAYAGAALCCPEYRYIMKGAEMGDSFNFNLHKWMLVNFDCCAMWLKNAGALTESFNVDRIYLKHQYQGQSKCPDYRHWQIQLGRRFRALKVWITLRTYGAENIRGFIRSNIALAEKFEALVRTDERFEVVIPCTMALVVFRLKGECTLTKTLLERITERKNIYMIPAICGDKLVIRYVICGLDPQVKDMEYAWNEIKTQADFVLNDHFKIVKIPNETPASDAGLTAIPADKGQMFDKVSDMGKITQTFATDLIIQSGAEKSK